MYDDSDNPFLTVQETADLLRIKPRTLDNFRWTLEGPLWRRHGGRVIYHRDEVLAWSEQRRARTHTANERRRVDLMAAHAPRITARTPHPYRMATLPLGLVLLIGRGQQPLPAHIWNASASVS